MKKLAIKRVFATILSLMFIVSLSLTAYANTADTVTVKSATNYLNPYDEAVEALEKLVQERKIDALIYLTDAYGIKEKADPNSETVATLASGQTVQIVGVSQDSGQNIWYQVEYNYLEDTITGFVEREYLAFVDERLLEWNDTYVKSRQRMMLKMRKVTSADVEQFPESYKDIMYSLKDKHPNWTFVRMDTGLDWNNVLAKESSGSYNLISTSRARESWKKGVYGTGWSYCTPEIIAYYLDPRNFLTDTDVFQFEFLSYNQTYHTVSATQQVLDGTFMKGLVPDTNKTYATVFTEIGQSKNISPLLLASRVRQEQGAGNSGLISGTYPGFEGLYNYYNIGASGKTNVEIITSGLQKAREKNWTSRMASLTGGAEFLGGSYIGRGQNTLYLQKFDVDNSDGVLWHQYMQNVQAPTSESQSTYKAYNNAGIISSAPFVFRIPVYKNMPSYAVTKPDDKERLTMSPTDITNLPVDETAVLNTYLNGSINTAVEMEFISSNPSVASVDSKGVITGVAPGTATITCKRKNNPEFANETTASVSVIKADISLSKITQPDLDEISYDPDVTLGDISLPEGYTWVDKSLTPTVDNQGYSVIYNPDNSKYNSITFAIPLTVNKAQLPEDAISIPKGLEVVAGTELSAVSLPLGFTWENPTQITSKRIGVYTYDASYCNDAVNYEPTTGLSIPVEILCKSHEFGEWTGTNADCTHDGTLTRSCSICDEKETIKEDAIGHNYTSKITKQPTETKAGIRTFACENCGDSYTEQIPATGESHTHKYTSAVTKEPTCLTTGIKTFTCSCNHSYEETVEALGHNVVNGSCTRCEYTEPVLPIHTHSYTLSGTTATCIQAGEDMYTCSCGSNYTEQAAALGHDIADGKCTRCDYVVPTPTATPKPTETPKPTATPTAVPTATPKPTDTPKPTSTATAKPTDAPMPTETPKPTDAPVSTPAPTQDASAPTQDAPTSVAQVITPAVTTNAATDEDSLNIVRINLQHSTVLTGNKIGKLKEDEKEIQLMMTDDIMWNIDVSSIENLDELNIDMAVELGDAKIPREVLDTISDEEPYVLMSLAYDGPFEFDATLSIPVEKQYQELIANLFYYNTSLDRMEFIASAIPDKNGYASFNMKHASDYAIVFADTSLETISNDTQTTTEAEENAVEVSNTKSVINESTENIILIVAVVVLIIVFLLIIGLILKFRSKKDEDYYLDEEDDEEEDEEP